MSDRQPDLTELFARARQGDRRARNEIVEQHMGFAAHIARRYSSSRSGEDLRQAAMIGLIKAAERFDPELGASFTAFAGVTIEGELKRHLRDRTWAVRVPRPAKELHFSVTGAGERLRQTLGRSPTVDEIAEHLEISRDDVLRGMAAGAARDVGSIDQPTVTGRSMADSLPSAERGDEAFLDRELVHQLLDRLPERDRRIVELRFFEEMSQSEIAETVGVSQMHVSRLLRSAFDRMRALAGDIG